MENLAPLFSDIKKTRKSTKDAYRRGIDERISMVKDQIKKTTNYLERGEKILQKKENVLERLINSKVNATKKKQKNDRKMII